MAGASSLVPVREILVAIRIAIKAEFALAGP
jgi:hypothetical protein